MAAPARTQSIKTDNEPRYEGLRVTREEYLDLEPDGFKYDMIEGVLHLSPSADFEHGEAYGEFFFFVRSYLKEHPVGRATQETDIMLPDGGDVLRPDGCLLLNENWHKKKRRIHGAPDMIWETLSDSSEERDRGEKSRRYLACGVREYWLLDPRVKSIELYCATRNPAGELVWERGTGNPLESRLLPGFKIDPQTFWDFIDQ